MTARYGSMSISPKSNTDPAPEHSPRGHRVDYALKAEIEQLQTEVTKLETAKAAIEAIAARHRADSSVSGNAAAN
jgi:hypothetical protein